MKDDTKVTTKVYAVLTENFTYTAHDGDNTIRKGRKFEPFGRNTGCYIHRDTKELILKNWVQYGDATVIPATGYKLVEEVTTTTVVKTTRPYAR